jgi:hypothetical protein
MADINTELKNGAGLPKVGRGADRDDDDEIEMRIDKPVLDPIDRAGSAFDHEVQRYVGGINTTPSVFSRQTLFNVTPERSDTQEKQEMSKEPYGTHSDR